MPRWIWSSKQKKLVTPEEYAREVDPPKRARYYVQPDIEPFVSPVTGEVIGSNVKLREHNRVNSVTNAADYKETWKQWEKDRKRPFQKGQKDRLEALREAVHKHSGRR